MGEEGEGGAGQDRTGVGGGVFFDFVEPKKALDYVYSFGNITKSTLTSPLAEIVTVLLYFSTCSTCTTIYHLDYESLYSNLVALYCYSATSIPYCTNLNYTPCDCELRSRRIVLVQNFEPLPLRGCRYKRQ